MAEEREPNSHGLAIPLGLALGAGLGVSLGAVFGALSGDEGMRIALGVPPGAGVRMSLAITMGVVLAAQQKRRGECPACGYATRGLRSKVCPEFGTSLVPTDTGKQEDGS